MKSHMLLMQKVLVELGTWCCVCTDMDLKTIHARFEHEGLSFLTIGLPAFASDFQKSLDIGKVARNLFMGYTRKGSLPRFLGGFFELVFDRSSGEILDSPSLDAIFSIRQITMMFGKMAEMCSDERINAAMDGYIKTEQHVKESDARLTDAMRLEFERLSRLLWWDALYPIDKSIYEQDIILPKHGPGSTADRLVSNEKFYQSEWTERLEKVFPHMDYLIPNWHFLDEIAHVNLLEPGAERPVKVITVPKTMKTPRIIAMEPTCMQYMQQGLLERIVGRLEEDDISKSFVGFTDQVPNQDLALKGSLYGELATLDLSEASDRVSNQHVRMLLARLPNLASAVDACRSRKADVKGHGVIRLAKFASMGSALCFPMEAMVFTTVIFLGIQNALSRPLTPKDIKSFRGKVRVYGDDIIIPVEYTRHVVEYLELFGFKVNSGKSFWTGRFRESCGKDYFNGTDITVVRVRRALPTHRGQTEEIVSAVSLRNQLYKRGLWQTVKWLDDYIERLIPFPAVAETSPALGKHNFTGYETQKVSGRYQRALVRAYKVSDVTPPNALEGYAALMKFFLKRGDMPFADRNHLQFAGRAKSLNMKLGWYHSH